MNKKEINDEKICQRCRNSEILFSCISCPKPFDKLCFECDTYVHSIMPSKRLHLRTPINNIMNINNSKEVKIINSNEGNNAEIENRVKELIDLIKELKLENNNLKNNIIKIVEENKIIKEENKEFLKEINLLKIELEQKRNQINLASKDLNKSNTIINELNNSLRLLKNELDKKEIELVELKEYFNRKIYNTKYEKDYLLSQLDNSNNKLINKNTSFSNLKEENELYKKRLIDFEKENYENLKIISQLHKENKELIHRINKLTNNI